MTAAQGSHTMKKAKGLFHSGSERLSLTHFVAGLLRSWQPRKPRWRSEEIYKCFGQFFLLRRMKVVGRLLVRPKI